MLDKLRHDTENTQNASVHKMYILTPLPRVQSAAVSIVSSLSRAHSLARAKRETTQKEDLSDVECRRSLR